MKLGASPNIKTYFNSGWKYSYNVFLLFYLPKTKSLEHTLRALYNCGLSEEPLRPAHDAALLTAATATQPP